jgi:hypothetical protein
MDTSLLSNLLQTNSGGQPNLVPSVSSVANGQAAAPGTVSNLGQESQQLGQYEPNGNGSPKSGANDGPQAPWWERALPTAGGIVGSIGGDILGGIAAPFTAGVVNPWDTSTVLSGVLSGAGKAAENGLTGQSLDKGVMSTALANAGGNLAGEGIGFVGGKVLKGATGALGKIVDNRAAQSDADKAAQASIDEAATIKNNYGGVKPGVQSANNLSGNLDLLKQFGVDHTDPQAMADASKGGLFINDIDNAALATGAPVKTTDLISSHDITTASPEEQQALVNSGIITPEGRLPDTVTPVQANQFAQELNGQLRDLKATMDNAQANGRVADYNAAKLQYSNLDKMYKNVQNVAATPEVNTTIASRTISPEEKQSLVDQFGQQEADHIEQAVNNAQNHQDLVNAKLPFAQMNTISKQALQDMKATATPRALARTKADVTAPETAASGGKGAGLLDAAAVTAAPFTHGASLAVLLPHVIQMAKNPETQQNAYNLLSKVTGSATAKKMVPLLLRTAGVMGANLPNDAASPVSDTMGVNNDSTNGNPMQPQAQVNPLEQAYNAALLHPYMPGALSVLQTLAPVMQKEQAASSAINTLGQNFANAGGAQGLEGGLMTKLSGLMPGSAANTYNRQQGSTAALLAQLLGGSPETYMQSMPQFTQTQQTAQPGMNNLSSILGSLTPTGAY